MGKKKPLKDYPGGQRRFLKVWGVNVFSAGIIPLCNIAIGLKVGVGVFAIFVALILLDIEVEEEEKK